MKIHWGQGATTGAHVETAGAQVATTGAVDGRNRVAERREKGTKGLSFLRLNFGF